MIGSTIETDLIGELIDVLQPIFVSSHLAPAPGSGGATIIVTSSFQAAPPAPNDMRVIASGRVRAATSGINSELVLWIEVMSEADMQIHPSGLPQRPRVGDIIRVATAHPTGDDRYATILRLRRDDGSGR